MSDRKPNLLIHESSPYLLQHAYNPVDWHPWNSETLELARQQNKMMLISIGYSSCHWCHVMEHESFENNEVAETMNKHFICIKVDREERPDVDHLFMDAVHLLGQRGGWPLNCVALPDGRPVWGGTYFRRDQWMGILLQIAELFDKQPEALIEQAEQLTQSLKENRIMKSDKSWEDTDDALLRKMMASFAGNFDLKNGGSKGAPKFPLPDNLLFQLLAGNVFTNSVMTDHVRLTLTRMAVGGIYDQLAGGFARYSVDDRWHIPHFEKMLYDNAQLITLYAEAYRQFQDPLFAEVCQQTIQFLQTDMRGPEGGYYAAIDADSEGVEGKYYVWTRDEFNEVLGDDAPLVTAFFGIDGDAHWEDGLNVLVLPKSVTEFSLENGLDAANFAVKLKHARQLLLSKRKTRIPPQLDDKRLCSWNVLMISALCHAHIVFDDPAMLAQAKQTANFVLSAMRQPDGGLWRSWKDGRASVPAFLDDYSLLINALIQLHQSSQEEEYLVQAKMLADYVLDHFSESGQPMFGFAESSQTELVVPPTESYDNVMPSSNAAMCMALVKLGMLFGLSHYISRAEAMLFQVKPMMAGYPGGFSHWAQALMMINGQKLLVIRGPFYKEAAVQARRKLGLLTLVAAADKKSLIPAVQAKSDTGKLQYWYCDHSGCLMPAASFGELQMMINQETS